MSPKGEIDLNNLAMEVLRLQSLLAQVRLSNDLLASRVGDLTRRIEALESKPGYVGPQEETSEN